MPDLCVLSARAVHLSAARYAATLPSPREVYELRRCAEPDDTPRPRPGSSSLSSSSSFSPRGGDRARPASAPVGTLEPLAEPPQPQAPQPQAPQPQAPQQQQGSQQQGQGSRRATQRWAVRLVPLVAPPAPPPDPFGKRLGSELRSLAMHLAACNAVGGNAVGGNAVGGSAVCDGGFGAGGTVSMLSSSSPDGGTAARAEALPEELEALLASEAFFVDCAERFHAFDRNR